MSDARAYAQRNQQGSDWFTHDGKPAAVAPSSPAHKAQTEPITADSPRNGAASCDTGRAHLIKPKCDSNQWFKHDNPAATEAAAPESAAVESHETPAAGAKPTARDGHCKASGGNEYCKRDKAGTSGSWFSHDHAGEAAAAAPAGGPRVTSKEGGDNASRMRGESENWFNYDATKAAPASGADLHVSKGRNANRAQNDDMHHIFHQGK